MRRIGGSFPVRQYFNKQCGQRIKQREENSGKDDVEADVKFSRQLCCIWLESLSHVDDLLKEGQRHADAKQSVEQVTKRQPKA